MRRQNKKVYLTPRDRKILVFLWRWKFASTMGLHARYFRKTRPMAAYNRLRKLERSGYLTPAIVKGFQNLSGH